MIVRDSKSTLHRKLTWIPQRHPSTIEPFSKHSKLLVQHLPVQSASQFLSVLIWFPSDPKYIACLHWRQVVKKNNSLLGPYILMEEFLSLSKF